MARIRKLNNLPRRVADILNSLYWATNKLQKNCSSIGFVDKCVQHGLIPTFAKVKGNFPSENAKRRVEKGIIISERKRHSNETAKLMAGQNFQLHRLKSVCGEKWANLLMKDVREKLRSDNIKQLRKNQKLYKLSMKHRTGKDGDFSVPIINLSGMEIDSSIIRYGLNHCFVSRDRFFKQDLAVELESLAYWYGMVLS